MDDGIDWFSIATYTMLDLGIGVIVLIIEDNIVSDSTVVLILVLEDTFSIGFIIWVVVVVSEDVFVKLCDISSMVVDVISDIVVGLIFWDVVISVLARVGSVITIVSVEIDDGDIRVVDEWNDGSDLSVVVSTIVISVAVDEMIGIVSDDSVLSSNVVVDDVSVDVNAVSMSAVDVIISNCVVVVVVVVEDFVVVVVIVEVEELVVDVVVEVEDFVVVVVIVEVEELVVDVVIVEVEEFVVNVVVEVEYFVVVLDVVEVEDFVVVVVVVVEVENFFMVVVADERSGVVASVLDVFFFVAAIDMNVSAFILDKVDIADVVVLNAVLVTVAI